MSQLPVPPMTMQVPYYPLCTCPPFQHMSTGLPRDCAAASTAGASAALCLHRCQTSQRLRRCQSSYYCETTCDSSRPSAHLPVVPATAQVSVSGSNCAKASPPSMCAFPVIAAFAQAPVFVENVQVPVSFLHPFLHCRDFLHLSRAPLIPLKPFFSCELSQLGSNRSSTHESLPNLLSRPSSTVHPVL